MDFVLNLLVCLSEAVAAFCPYQFLPAAASQLFEIEGKRYRVLKQVCACCVLCPCWRSSSFSDHHCSVLWCALHHPLLLLLLQQIGEGGYAFVYLAKPLPAAGCSPSTDPPVAVKKILASSSEKLAEAKREIQVLQALSHVNCLPLLAHAINPSSSAAAGRAYDVLLVFPAYPVCARTPNSLNCQCLFAQLRVDDARGASALPAFRNLAESAFGCPAYRLVRL